MKIRSLIILPKSYKSVLSGIQAMINQFMSNCLERSSSTITNLRLLQRFEEMNIPSLQVLDQYKILFVKFKSEIDDIKKVF